MSANFDAEIAERIKAKSQNTKPENGPSRIEDINARLARLERQHADLGALGDDQKRNIIKARTDEAVIRIEAASVNPSDVKNVAGGIEWTVLPRTPGRDFAGVVVSGPPEWQGVAVWGTGGDTGFTRDGSHAQLMSVPVEALVRKPERLGFDDLARANIALKGARGKRLTYATSRSRRQSEAPF